MSRFYVGQRVRILWSKAWPELSGQQGMVVGTDPGNCLSERSEYRVAPDSWGSDYAPCIAQDGAVRFAPGGDQLEPILPEGAAPSEFETLADLLESLEVTA